MKPLISFLILTHKRHELFQRCIKSILDLELENLNIPYEIMVNNDSKDIIEIKRYNIKYYYNTKEVNKLYPFIFDKSNGEFVYFLEDDDIINKDIIGIFENIDEYDIHLGRYNAYNKKRDIEQLTNKKIIYDHFQLSQIIFRKSLITSNDFPNIFDNENDEILFQTLLDKNPKLKNHKLWFFTQGIDGQNLSIKEII